MVNYEEELRKFIIIDAHTHLGVTPDVYYANYNDENVISLLREFNVVKSICSHTIGIFFSIEAQVDYISDLSEKFGGYIYWYVVYDPRKAERSIEIIGKLRNNINFAGVKIHPYIHETSLDSKNYDLLWEYSELNDIVILSHTWSPYTDNPKQFFSNPLLLETVLKRFGSLKIILGHSGGKMNFYQKVMDFASKYKSVYLEFSGDIFYPGIFNKALSSVGKERVLFGSDMPMFDIRYPVINVLKSDISDKDKENIFYNNAKRLFKF